MADTELKILDEALGGGTFRIRPKDIEEVTGFGKCEIEEVAENLVGFFRRKDGWAPFTVTELFQYCLEVRFDPNKMFLGLLGHWFDVFELLPGYCQTPACLVQDIDGTLYVTEEFVLRCAGEFHAPKAGLRNGRRTRRRGDDA